MHMKSYSTLMGIGLVILWAVGLGDPSASQWLTWLNGFAALCAFGLAGFSAPFPSRQLMILGPAGISFGLVALWAVALSRNVVPWQTWWTFAFGCGFLVLAIFGVRTRRAPSLAEITEIERERERFRRGA